MEYTLNKTDTDFKLSVSDIKLDSIFQKLAVSIERHPGPPYPNWEKFLFCSGGSVEKECLFGIRLEHIHFAFSPRFRQLGWSGTCIKNRLFSLSFCKAISFPLYLPSYERQNFWVYEENDMKRKEKMEAVNDAIKHFPMQSNIFNLYNKKFFFKSALLILT